MRKLVGHLLVPFLVGVAAGDETERAKLRSAVRLPVMKLSVGASMTSADFEGLEAFAVRANAQESEAKQAEPDEAALREAVELDPEDWQAWVKLGGAQGLRAWRLLLPYRKGYKVHSDADLQAIQREVVEANPAPETVAEARRLFDAERDCHDRAVTLAPAEPRARAARARFRMGRGIFESCFLALERRPRRPTTLRDVLLPPDAIADLRALGKMRPEDPKVLECMLIAGFCSFLLYGSPDIATLDDEKKEIQALSKALEKTVEGASADVAARVLELIGLVEITVFEDRDRGAEYARRALALDPTREKSIDLLLVSLGIDHKFAEVVKACDEALRRKESLRLRLVKAIAHDRLDQLREAEEEVRAALKIAPDDFRANLALSVLLLKKGDDEVLGAKVQIDRARKLLGEDPSPDDRVAFEYVYGAFAAVVGSKDTAKEYLRRVLDADKTNQQAADLLRIISGEPPPERA